RAHAELRRRAAGRRPLGDGRLPGRPAAQSGGGAGRAASRRPGGRREEPAMTAAAETPPPPLSELRPARPFEGGRRVLLGGLLAGLVGTALLVFGLFVDAKQVFFSYLVAYAYLFTLVLGAGAFIMSMHAASAIWSTAVRRLAEAVLAILPLVALLVAPIFLGADLLYPWMHPEGIAREEVRQVVLHKRSYLNLPFVIVRALAYFAFFLLVARLLLPL